LYALEVLPVKVLQVAEIGPGQLFIHPALQLRHFAIGRLCGHDVITAAPGVGMAAVQEHRVGQIPQALEQFATVVAVGDFIQCNSLVHAAGLQSQSTIREAQS
jgi:orotidine-5'-phosphate decarboxylase